MSQFSFPFIITDGLVFYYDAANIKSYKGPPIQNLLTGRNAAVGTGTGYSIIGATDIVSIPELGDRSVLSVDIQNNYTSFTPNSNQCCPALISFSPCNVSSSTVHTYGIVYKVESGYTNSNYMYRYEYTSNGGAFVTEGGVHNNSNRVLLGNGWYYAWGTFTTQTNTNYLSYTAAFYYRYAQTYDKFSLAQVMIAPGNYPGLHPKYWPDLGTTRSNTQTIVDLTNRHTVTVNSLTYASTGTFSFNGSTNFLQFTPTIQFGSIGYTIEFILSVNAPSSMHGVLLWGGGPFNSTGKGIEVRIQTNTMEYTIADGVGAGIRLQYSFANIADGNFRHFAIVQNPAGTATLYVNGVSVATQSYAGESLFTDTYTFWVGRGNDGYLNGVIPVFKLYNKVLNVGEIQQNFAALRGRYNI